MGEMIVLDAVAETNVPSAVNEMIVPGTAAVLGAEAAPTVVAAAAIGAAIDTSTPETQGPPDRLQL